MTTPDTEIEAVFARLERIGLIKRWFCEPCDDHVPYRCFEMTEPQSRRKHNRSRHPKKPAP